MKALFAEVDVRPNAVPPKLPALVKDKTIVTVKYVMLHAVPNVEIQAASSKLGTRLRKISTIPNTAQKTAYELKQSLPEPHASFAMFCNAVAAVITLEIETKINTTN